MITVSLANYSQFKGVHKFYRVKYFLTPVINISLTRKGGTSNSHLNPKRKKSKVTLVKRLGIILSHIPNIGIKVITHLFVRTCL